MVPPVVVHDASCADERLIFRPLDAAAVPEIAAVLARLREEDPDVIAAVADVDRSLLWAAMARSPIEHLNDCARAVESLTDFRDRAEAFADGKRA